MSNDDECISLSFKNGILYAKFEKSNLILDDAKKSVLKRSKFTDIKGALPIVIDISEVEKISRDARLYLSSQESNEGLVAAAIIAPNGFAKALANFFIRVNLINPIIPTKMFTSEQEALIWLKKYKQEQND